MSDARATTMDWTDRLAALLPLFGHRNWIVVADSAYPAQSQTGIETIVAAAGQINVLRIVLGAINACSHVRANVYLDAELDFVTEQSASGVENYRRELHSLMTDTKAVRLPHEEIIAKLDRAAQMFRILILKTELAIPYTSVFFELDCGYWSADREQELRSAILSVPAKSGRTAGDEK